MLQSAILEINARHPLADQACDLVIDRIQPLGHFIDRDCHILAAEALAAEKHDLITPFSLWWHHASLSDRPCRCPYKSCR